MGVSGHLSPLLPGEGSSPFKLGKLFNIRIATVLSPTYARENHKTPERGVGP
jgi:hypothetical protein